MIKKTPLFDIHKKLGAKMIEFSNWHLPLEYNSIISEYESAKSNCTVFDAMHSTLVNIYGKDATNFLSFITTSNLSKLEDNSVIRTLLLKEDGTIIDDPLLYRISSNRIMLRINADNKEKVISWLTKHSSRWQVIIDDKSYDLGIIALNGPNSIKIAESLLQSDLTKLNRSEFMLATVGEINLIIAYVSYIDFEGVELIISRRNAIEIWNLLTSKKNNSPNLKPIGLGTCNLLRLEMKKPLYGIDVAPTNRPSEVGFEQFVDFEKDVDFIGREALSNQEQSDDNEILVGLTLEGPLLPRALFNIYSDDEKVGIIKSATYSPLLSKGIALASIKKNYASLNKKLFVDIRGEMILASLVTTDKFI
ncbi:MAG: glycine cleavage T C-terminal barrel domain-containing protein [Nitrospinota bacterium]